MGTSPPEPADHHNRDRRLLMATPARSGTTRQRLIDGALETVRQHGIAATSARTIAATAEVNQALIFYHFGSVHALLAEACRHATGIRIEQFRTRLAAVDTVNGLLSLGRVLHSEERALGNLAVLAQLLAGAQRDEQLAPAVAGALRMWTAEIEAVLSRLLTDHPLAAAFDIPGLAVAVSAGFVGIELFDGVDGPAAATALDALERLAVLIDVADELGPVATRVLRRRLAGAGAAKQPPTGSSRRHG
jgi:AcrR family transcriptional regulator